MKRFVLALAVLIGAAFASAPSWAATVPLGALPGVINPLANEQKGAGSSATIDYTFSLAEQSQFTVSSIGPFGVSNGKTTGLSALSLELRNSSNTLIAVAGSVPLGGALLTGFTDLLNAGSYTLSVLLTKDPARDIFDVTTSVTVAVAAATPVPAAGLLLLTALGGLGGLGFWRKRGASAA